MIHVGDGTWNLRVLITDLQVEKTLRVKGDLHIGGVMLKLVDPGGFLVCDYAHVCVCMYEYARETSAGNVSLSCRKSARAFVMVNQEPVVCSNVKKRVNVCARPVCVHMFVWVWVCATHVCNKALEGRITCNAICWATAVCCVLESKQTALKIHTHTHAKTQVYTPYTIQLAFTLIVL